MVDFGALPPEVNSARMYTGPGSSSLQAAASAWNGLAAELQSAAQGYETTITQLANDEWNGPASTAMASAAQPYVTWMQETAAAAEQAATQARTAAAAYEQAFAATVPPPMIAANRAETAAATQANVFGQYTALIAQLEAQYGQMWAQDATAMYGYAGQSAAAAKVTPFATPAATTNPGGTATQAAAVSQATATSAATSSQSLLQQLTQSMPSSLQSLASPAAQPGGHLDATSIAVQLLVRNERPAHKPRGVGHQLLAVRQLLLQTPRVCRTSALVWATSAFQIAKSAGLLGGAAPAAAAPALPGLGGLGAGLGGGAAGAGAGAHAVSAISGGGGSVGKLAVPASWVGATPAGGPKRRAVGQQRQRCPGGRRWER